jgi:RNA polymerase sigma factor (sigma-70 family)
MGVLSDPAAFRALFDAQFAPVYRYLAHRLGDRSAAEDLAAETFLRAYRARSRFRPARDGSARAWLFAIATNLLRDDARSRRRRDAAYARLAARDGSAAALPQPGPPDPELAAALATLREEEREALLLYAWAELSYEEIAAATGVATGTVRSRLGRARARLIRELAPETPERSAR